MTVKGVMAVILRYFTEFCSFGANYVKVDKCLQQQCSAMNLHCDSEKRAVLFAKIILSNLNRFSKFFNCCKVR